jgi:transposase
MPAAFGERRAVFEGLRRLSSSGAWDAVVSLLRTIAPGRIPAKSTQMFCTVVGRYSTSLKGLPEIRARHGLEIAVGKFTLSDDEWERICDLVPEQVLMVDKKPARIAPRDFLNGVFYLLKSGVPVSHMPLQLGSETYFSHSLRRLVQHGYWDRIVERLANQSPATLGGVAFARLDSYSRSPRQQTVWRRALASGIPSHAPTKAEWSLIKHLFPIELLYVEDKLAVDNPRRLAHALLYRVKEKVPVAAFPEYFGNKWLLKLTLTKFAFHYLWDEMVTILQKRSPETLKGADLEVFSKYKRAKTRRYAHLLPAVEEKIPPHAPSDAHWALVEDLIPERLLVVRGKPAIMEPRRFLHAVLFMVTEKVQFGGLSRHYFGPIDDIRFAMRKFVRHHLWDTMAARFRHFDEGWAAGLDLAMFDKLARSTNDNPDFREHRVRKVTL